LISRFTERRKGDRFMLFARTGRVSAIALSLLICTAATVQGQSSPERLNAIQQRLTLVKQEAISKLPPQLQKALSGGAQNFLAAAKALENMQSTVGAIPQDKLDSLKTALEAKRASVSNSNVSVLGPIRVSDPSTDLLYSLLEGMTQSETSTAWCGSGVVVGFNDSGSVLESMLFGPGGTSFAGAGASTNGGNTFKNIGFINPGSNAANFLFGDPVVNCTNASTFYLSQIGNGGTFDAPTSTVVVSKSTNGGFTWDDPVETVSKDAFTDALDKDWSAIDPKNPQNIYVSYTDFDMSGFLMPGTPCPNSERIAIEVVHSTDGGATWSAPTVVAQLCTLTANFIQGSQIVVDSHGNVYIEWEEFPEGLFSAARIFRIKESTNHASTFGSASTIAIGSADGGGVFTADLTEDVALEGLFRNSITGNLAVDLSGTGTDGNLYFIWDDGGLASRIDFATPSGLYQFGNILISRSTNGGKAWSKPVRVNNDPLYSSAGIGIDHFQPGVAVNANGELAACWYDRRDDRHNFNIGRYCGTSTDQGKFWSNAKVDARTWPPIHDNDSFVTPLYLGDYDTVTSDGTKASLGFQGAYARVDGPFGQDVFEVHVH
jgi:hypothetical protein